MKQGIHPEYTEIKASCSCGNVMNIRSTLGKDINLDVCSSCHPFYTGKQRNVDTGGRVDRFKKRFGALGKKEV
ncbi:50S ribosomal protein L31 [Alteromonas australica]|nr:50S ribosomal protein L31 [Alteromonas australica]